MNKTVLVVAAHSDDEALGCGGTIARHVAEGDVVHAVFLADGVTSRIGASPEEHAAREAAASASHKVLGISTVFFLGFPDNRMDSVPLLDVVKALEVIVEKTCPEIIYTHNHNDLNVDHRIAHEATLTACRPVPGSSVKEIYAFEVLSSTEWMPSHTTFQPDCYMDISDYFSEKMKSIDCYHMEMRAAPHSRSRENVRALAGFRGMCVGVLFAEAFKVVRIVR
ncbi:PIG-L family deacetylase [Pseudomonas stutzeri]|uniref:PIG-L deacetylase family protein n=1 Tax=Stutzerimonas stutzeri TaxID=316 RepID=UPI00210A5F30|nr:PIG-L deacetylase family protein [Stutzerimonas stutzeri]MCQ4312604.1 PIG-L family deacetylase [Stutzerimonas stutzeri]